MAYAPTIVTVGHYFEKRRALANGITVAGSSVGNFAVPPLMRFLLDYYGLQGALLVLAGIMLHVCMCAMLLRPITFYKQIAQHRIKSNTVIIGSTDDAGDETTIAKHTNVHDDKTYTNNVNGVLIEKETSFQPLVEDQHPRNEPITKLEGLDLKDVVYGSLQSIPRQVTIDEENAPRKFCTPLCCSSTKSGASKSLPKFDWKLLKHPVFLLYAFSVLFAFCGYPQLFFIVPDHAKQLGINKNHQAFLVSIIGITDLIGRIGFGWVADCNLVKKKTIFCGSMAIAGVSCFFIPFLTNFAGLAVFCSMIGLFAGAFIALTAVILAEGLGVHQLQSAFGLVVMFMGLSFLFAPATAGKTAINF